MTTPPIRRPKPSNGGDVSSLLRYVNALEQYCQIIEGIGRTLERESAALRAALRDTIYRIEAVLEDAALDDGMVSVGALMRLDAHYFTVLKPIREKVSDE